MAKKLKVADVITVKASALLKATRYACLPAGLLTRKESRDLKAGETVVIEQDKFEEHKRYFVEENGDGNS